MFVPEMVESIRCLLQDPPCVTGIRSNHDILQRGHSVPEFSNHPTPPLLGMKTFFAITLGFACFTTATLRGTEKLVRAAVVAQAINAELRNSTSIRAAGRKSFEVGEVYECATTTGRYGELKIDANQVALVPVTALRIRECTPAQLAEAQTKFNVLSYDSQRDARKELAVAKKQAQNQAASCSTCPSARAAALNASIAAKKACTEQAKALRQNQQALAKEALDWAAD